MSRLLSALAALLVGVLYTMLAFNFYGWVWGILSNALENNDLTVIMMAVFAFITAGPVLAVGIFLAGAAAITVRTLTK